MKNKLLLFLVYSYVFLMKTDSAQTLTKKTKGHLKTAIFKSAKDDYQAKSNYLLEKLKNLTHDTSGVNRQEIAYNLDLVNHNGSSTLLYSQEKDVVNGGFTDWSSWSKCSSACGKRSLRSRERYCTSPSPSNDGADCEGERFQLDTCTFVPCAKATTSPTSHKSEDSSYRSIDKDEKSPPEVSWRLGEWSGWSKCNCDKGYQRRYRECYSHGGMSCPGSTVDTKACRSKDCQEPERSSLVNVDPKDFCGFNPCDFSKCLLSPLGSCVSDYKCRPVFFDEKNKRVKQCVGKRIYINPVKVSQVCKVNPCDFSRCLMDFTEERCVVGTRCQAVYYSAEGKPQKCTAILKVPARQVCGYDPCSGETCPERPNARCLVSSKCRPIYVNAFNERIKICEEKAGKRKKVEAEKEDEFEAEPDENEDDHDDDDDDDADEKEDDNEDNKADENEFIAKLNDNEDDEDDEDNIKINGYNKHNDNDEEEDDGDDDNDDDNDDDDNDDDDNYSGNFKNFLNVNARGEDEHNNVNNPLGLKMAGNAFAKNVSKPLLSLINTENGQRRTKGNRNKPFSKNFNASSLNLDDIVKGKLDHSDGVISGTVQKSMKILSSKKPATYYYFETKGSNGNENRQFMVITSPKAKKSSVLSKSIFGTAVKTRKSSALSKSSRTKQTIIPAYNKTTKLQKKV